MRFALALAVAVTLSLCACGDKGSPAAGAAPPFAEGAAMFPAEARALIGLRVDKLGQAPIAQRVVDWLLATDPTQRQALTELLAACAIDPRKDVESVAIGIGAGPEEVAVLARGRLDETALVACLRDNVTKKGGTLAVRTVAGRAVHNAVDPQAGTSIWVAFDGGTGVVVATGEAWMAKVLDPAVPKASGRAETAALVGRVGGDALIWAAIHLPPEAGARVVTVTKGAVKQGPVSLTGELAQADLAAVKVKLDLPTNEDAAALVEFVRSQQIWLALAAQKLGIGRIVNKVALAVEGKQVSISVALDQLEMTQLVEALDKLAEK